MQTTLNIDDAIVARLHAEAKRRGTTASALAEAGIRQILGGAPNSVENHGPLPEPPKKPTPPNPDDTVNKAKLRRQVEEDLGEPFPQTAEELFEKLPKWDSGGEMVDITNKEELYRVMDEYDGFRY